MLVFSFKIPACFVVERVKFFQLFGCSHLFPYIYSHQRYHFYPNVCRKKDCCTTIPVEILNFIKVISLNNTAFGVATKSNHGKHLRPTHQTMREFVFLQRLLLMNCMKAVHPVPNHPARYK